MRGVIDTSIPSTGAKRIDVVLGVRGRDNTVESGCSELSAFMDAHRIAMSKFRGDI